MIERTLSKDIFVALGKYSFFPLNLEDEDWSKIDR